MTYKRKTQDEYRIMGYFNSTYGWEEVCAEDTHREARMRLKEYRTNDKDHSYKITKKRVRIEA